MGETSDEAKARLVQMRTVVETFTTVTPDGITTVKTTKTIDEVVRKESRQLTTNKTSTAKGKKALEPPK